MHRLHLFRHRLRRTWRWLLLLSLWAGVGFAVAPEVPALQTEQERLTALVGLRDFDFVTWEANAIGVKVQSALTADHRYLDDATRRQVVLDFMAAAGDVRLLNRQLADLYATESDADLLAVDSAELTAALADRRRVMADLQPLAEAILQDQVAAVLADEGFAVLGTLMPPVQMHMTPLPSMLVVSPRDRIEQRYAIPLQHGLTVPEQEALEAAIVDQLDLSALVVPIGGLGVYPTMIVENGNLNWTAATIAHEWVHIWLLRWPLGYRYLEGGVIRTINETVASLVGDEIGALVIERYYPDRVPPPPTEGATEAPPPDEPPPFDFNAAMAETRIEADRLLAAGEIESAEQYMAARRELFVANGYLIRKINQAYFAFYGAYADQPGATGADPVGPAVVALRAASPSVRDFLRTAATITTLADLEAALAAVPPAPQAP